jgi:hypothetical protein
LARVLSAFFEEPLFPTVWRFAYSGTAAPSARLLDWLASRDTTLVYPVREVLGRPALVVLSPRSIPTEGPEAGGYVQWTYRGPDAPKVWILGPQQTKPQPAGDGPGRP